MLIEESKLHQLNQEKVSLIKNSKLRLVIYLIKMKLTLKNVAELASKKLVLKIKFSKLKDQLSQQLIKISTIRKKLYMLSI